MAVFPAYAGMNRVYRQPGAGHQGVPRICGDELQNNPKTFIHWQVFPAYAGMNRNHIAR